MKRFDVCAFWTKTLVVAVPSMHDVRPSKLTCFRFICRLFHIIVDTDKIAAHILSIMNKHKLPGEVTFMPLNRLQSKEHEYPSSPVSLFLDTTNN